MKKIMFNDELSLTKSVLDGNKRQTRRICKYDRPSDEWGIGFPIFEANDFNDEGECTSPLNYAFGWRNKSTGEEIKWNIPKYKVGEVVAIAQRYKDVLDFLPEAFRRKSDGYISSIIPTSAGLNNKMFVRAGLMPHKIKITDIKIERLQDISDEDCLKEGVVKGKVGNAHTDNWMDAYYTHRSSIDPCCTPREAFALLIDKVSGKGTWQRNPYVFAYEFELVK